MGKETARIIAEQNGDRYYPTSKRCKWGHTDTRYTSNAVCVTCSSDKTGWSRDPNLDPARCHKKYRRIARARGFTRFMSPFPCDAGHTDGRATSDGKCVTCTAERRRNYMVRPEVAVVQKAREARWREDNRDHVLAEKKRWYTENKDRAMELSNAWYHENKHLHRQYMKTCRERRPHVYRGHSKARARRVKQATVPFSNMRQITVLYQLCPVGYEVDHIVPLKAVQGSRTNHVACGLHVDNNLQYLTASANSAKSNFWSGTGSFDSNAIVPFSWEHFLVISEQA